MLPFESKPASNDGYEDIFNLVAGRETKLPLIVKGANASKTSLLEPDSRAKALLKNNLMIWRGIHTVGWLSGMLFCPPSNGVSDDEAILQGEDASLCLSALQSASLQCPGPRA
ncbi:MAG: hypothetical protein HY259_15385 [Chloroflexi bacterium]|nr:hypothetical protein [Chloroflexota bacterium]